MRGEPTERQLARENAKAQQEQRHVSAGDERFPVGVPSEAVKAYPSLIREEYQFGLDANKLDDDDIILQSGCNSVVEDI